MKESFKLVFVLTVICFVASFALAVANKVTAEPIRIAAEKQKFQAITDVLPGGASEPVELQFGDVTYWKTDKGVAFKQTAPDGYSGNIDLMLGFTADGNFYSYKVLEHSETPGLGSHIAGTFLDTVKEYAARDGGAVWKLKKDGGDIDAITAATISSRAVVGTISRGEKIIRDILNEQP